MGPLCATHLRWVLGGHEREVLPLSLWIFLVVSCSDLKLALEGGGAAEDLKSATVARRVALRAGTVWCQRRRGRGHVRWRLLQGEHPWVAGRPWEGQRRPSRPAA